MRKNRFHETGEVSLQTPSIHFSSILHFNLFPLEPIPCVTKKGKASFVISLTVDRGMTWRGPLQPAPRLSLFVRSGIRSSEVGKRFHGFHSSFVRL